MTLPKRNQEVCTEKVRFKLSLKKIISEERAFQTEGTTCPKARGQETVTQRSEKMRLERGRAPCAPSYLRPICLPHPLRNK